LFLKLWPGQWEEQLKQLNNFIENEFQKKSRNKPMTRHVKSVSPKEFFGFIGIIIVAGALGKGGILLWEKDSDRRKQGVRRFSPVLDMTKYMPLRRFEDIRSYFPFAFADTTRNDPSRQENYDPWYMLSKWVREFNANRREMVCASYIKVHDETMCAWKPRKNKTGGLPNISFIFRKPEPLGTEFKSGCCPETGIMLFLEIQRGKVEMPKWSQFFRELGATASCTVRAATYMANAGQAESDHQPNLFLGDSWFASVKTASEIKKLGHEFCGPVKTSHSLFPKTELEEKLKRWPGGTYLVMKATTSDGVELLAIGYKYNSTKVLTFIATTESGSTVPGTPYRARFVDDFDNLLSRPVQRPQVISTYFSRSNAVDKHNQARQSELKLEKHWKTQNVWFRLACTMIGITTTDAWKAYKYANNSAKEKAISIRELRTA
jgi:hypothetical protein